jgi:hypothetical protein
MELNQPAGRPGVMDAPFTVKDLKEAIKDIPDHYQVYVPIWGTKTAPVEDAYPDNNNERLNIQADVA